MTLFPIGADSTNKIIGEIKVNGIKTFSAATFINSFPGTRLTEEQWSAQSTNGIV